MAAPENEAFEKLSEYDKRLTVKCNAYAWEIFSRDLRVLARAQEDLQAYEAVEVLEYGPPVPHPGVMPPMPEQVMKNANLVFLFLKYGTMSALPSRNTGKKLNMEYERGRNSFDAWNAARQAYESDQKRRVSLDRALTDYWNNNENGWRTEALAVAARHIF